MNIPVSEVVVASFQQCGMIQDYEHSPLHDQSLRTRHVSETPIAVVPSKAGAAGSIYLHQSSPCSPE